MLYNIEFKHTEIYYLTETIEASSMEEAESIARRLVDTEDFQEDLLERSSYEDHEDTFLQVYENKRERYASFSAEEIASYLGEE